jgi:hypothetical protein
MSIEAQQVVTPLAAMKQALEALVEVVKWYQMRDKNDEPLPVHNQNPEIKQAIEAVETLRQAIAEAEKQEPVAWIYPDDLERFKTSETFAPAFSLEMVSPTQGQTVPLYTSPPQRQPLSDEQIEYLIFQSGGYKSTQNLMSNPMQVREYIELWNEKIYAFARAIEAAHGIKGDSNV